MFTSKKKKKASNKRMTGNNSKTDSNKNPSSRTTNDDAIFQSDSDNRRRSLRRIFSRSDIDIPPDVPDVQDKDVLPKRYTSMPPPILTRGNKKATLNREIPPKRSDSLASFLPDQLSRSTMTRAPPSFNASNTSEDSAKLKKDQQKTTAAHRKSNKAVLSSPSRVDGLVQPLSPPNKQQRGRSKIRSIKSRRNRASSKAKKVDHIIGDKLEPPCDRPRSKSSSVSSRMRSIFQLPRRPPIVGKGAGRFKLPWVPPLDDHPRYQNAPINQSEPLGFDYDARLPLLQKARNAVTAATSSLTSGGRPMKSVLRQIYEEEQVTRRKWLHINKCFHCTKVFPRSIALEACQCSIPDGFYGPCNIGEEDVSESVGATPQPHLGMVLCPGCIYRSIEGKDRGLGFYGQCPCCKAYLCPETCDFMVWQAASSPSTAASGRRSSTKPSIICGICATAKLTPANGDNTLWDMICHGDAKPHAQPGPRSGK